VAEGRTATRTKTRYGCFLPDLTGLARGSSAADLPADDYRGWPVEMQAGGAAPCGRRAGIPTFLWRFLCAAAYSPRLCPFSLIGHVQQQGRPARICSLIASVPARPVEARAADLPPCTGLSFARW